MMIFSLRKQGKSYHMGQVIFIMSGGEKTRDYYVAFNKQVLPGKVLLSALRYHFYGLPTMDISAAVKLLLYIGTMKPKMKSTKRH